MAQDVTLPALGESVTEGTVTRWLKAVGDEVAVDEPLVEISTDKVDTEIPSPVAGTLTEIVAEEDETVEVGAVLARIGDAGDAPAGDSAPSAEDKQPEPEPAAEEKQPEPEPEPAAEDEKPEPAPAAGGGDGQEVTLPALGESVTEGTVTRWLKSVGDEVEVDEPLVEISTDKVDTEIPSPVAGTLSEIVAQEDETVEVGAVLARIGGSAPQAESKPAPKAEAPKEEKPAPQAESKPAATEEPAPKAAEPQQEAKSAPAAASAPSASASAPAGDGAGYVTPIVRKLAAEKGVDLSTIAGTGVGGRIRKEDVLAAAEKAPAAKPAAGGGAAAPKVEVSDLRGQTVKMTKIRKVTAERLLESMQSMAQLTTVIEVDCTRIWAIRNKAKASFQEREGAKLTFLPFFTKAVSEALQEHAFLNASIDGENIVYHPAVNLGIAVDTPKGLMVPVIKDADSKSLADHAREIAELAGRARDGKATMDDLTGGTFTVTNTGSGGTLFDTPVVASPQVGILATPIIEKRPVVVKGPDGGDVISIRPMMYLPLSYDHRLVDGADAARFLQTVKERIEGGAFEADLGL